MDPQQISAALTTNQAPQKTKISLISSEETISTSHHPRHLDTKTEHNHCSMHGSFETEFVFIGGRWRGEALCPECKKEETARIEAEEQAAKGRSLIESKIRRAGIPNRFQGKSFGNYVVEPGNQAQNRAVTVCMNYAYNFSTVLEKGACLVFCGNPGTGKTHLAAAISNTIINRGPHSVVFTRVYSAIRAVKETFRNGCATTERDVLAAFIDVDLLILDEVGVQFNSDYERMILFEIINARYDAVRPTILISNLNAKDAEAFVGVRVWDRLFEDGGVVLPFDWQSERRKKR